MLLKKDALMSSPITLLGSVTIFCGTDKIMRNIPTFRLNVREYSIKSFQYLTNILHNIVMDLTNVMPLYNLGIAF